MGSEPSKPDEAFSRTEQIRFEIKRNKYVKAAAKVPWILFLTSLGGVALGVVCYSEWEIIYRVFEALMGEDNRYWSPVPMGLTAATMIVGFHLLAKLKPQNIAVKIVENSVGMLIPIYLFGIGILIACILFQEGLSDMLNVEIPDIIGGIPAVVEEGWLDAFFAHVTNPIAVMAFSLGIGGLAIVNIFVAHQLLTMIAKNGSDMFDRLTLAKSAISDHQNTQRDQREYAAIGAELDELDMQDDEDIKLMITDEVMSTISDALLPHKKWLQHKQYSSEFRFGVQDQKVDTKQMAKDIAKIEAIRPQDVMNAMNPRYLEKKTK